MLVILSAKIFQLLQSTPMYFFPFAIKTPTPFVEIFNEIPQMHEQHFPTLIGRRFVAMGYLYIGEINCPVMTMDSTRKINIIRIHEKSLIKYAYFFQGCGS